MTRADELNAEIRNQAVRLYPKCAGLFELPLMVYTQIVADNLTRSKPYRLSVERCKKIILTISAVTLTAGVLLTGIGYMKGGRFGFVFSDGKFISADSI